MQEHFVRHIFINFGVIGASFLLFGIALNVANRDIVLQSQEIVSARSILAHRAHFIENLATLKKEQTDAEPYRKAIGFLLPIQDSLLSFPQYLDSLARVYTVNTVFSFQGNPMPASASVPGYVPFSLSLDGSFDGIQHTMNDIESKTTRFTVVIDSVDFMKNGTLSHMSLQGKVFFR